MSDAIDAVAEAMAKTKQLAARRLVRKEELEGELARMREDRARVEAAGDVALLGEMDARIGTLTTELALVEDEYRSALAEMEELKKLAGSARTAGARALVASVLDADPVLQSPEEAALENVRGHLADLDAQSRLGDELAPEPVTPVPTEKPPSREELDAQARREFEEMRGKLAERKSAPPDDDPTPTPRKKTL